MSALSGARDIEQTTPPKPIAYAELKPLAPADVAEFRRQWEAAWLSGKPLLTFDQATSEQLTAIGAQFKAATDQAMIALAQGFGQAFQPLVIWTTKNHAGLRRTELYLRLRNRHLPHWLSNWVAQTWPKRFLG